MSQSTTGSQSEPQYEVVWPLGRSTVREVTPNPPLPDLNGKTIAELWDWLFKGDEMYALIREQLRQRYPDARFVDFSSFGNIHGQNEAEIIAALPQRLQELGCDAVITGIGA